MGKMGTAEKILLNYSGSTALSFLCDITDLSIDQVNFITCQVIALCLSVFMKKWLRDPQTRLIYSFVCGIGIALFCFGNQIFHIIAAAGIAYTVIRTNKTASMPWICLTANMMYLSCLHLERQFFDELGSYSLDITGPLMVLTQKVTSMAFSLQDTIDRKKSDNHKATEMQKRYAIEEVPTFLEFWSFVFQFQSMLAGPLVLFKDYQEFIHTKEFPSPLAAVAKKIGWSVFFAVVFIKATPVFPIETLKDAEFLWGTSLAWRMTYTIFATTLERAKYYHAWILADAVCNASGLGYDKLTQKWDLVTNVEAVNFELSVNFKEGLEEWNKGTMKWLRHVVYERTSPQIRTVATYSMSAIWHGFYPGYYMTFLTGALFTSAGRQIRKTIRPLFLQSAVRKKGYDIFTWVFTRYMFAYLTFSFVLLDFIPGIVLYYRLFFCMHFAAFGAIFTLPKLAKFLNKKQSASAPVHTGARVDSTTVHKTQVGRTDLIDGTQNILPRKTEDVDMLHEPTLATKEEIPNEFSEIKSYLNNSKSSSNDVWLKMAVNNQALNDIAAQLKTG